MKRNAFSTYHPIINFTFFVGALLLAMLLFHPFFLSVSVALSVICYMTINGHNGWKFIKGMVLVFFVLSLINPLFNTYGENVLFVYANGRPYTQEALCYGMALGAMFVSVLCWFASYNEVMSSDKLMYLLGSLAPHVTLVLALIFRMVPQYARKMIQLNDARRCIGKSKETKRKVKKIENSAVLVLALTSWALEGSVVIADSMKNRGYGLKNRTSFSIYRFSTRDKILLIIMLGLLMVIGVCIFKGGAYIKYTPHLEMADIQQPYTMIGSICYLIFLSVPTIINLWEKLIWYILKSKI